PRPLQQAVVDFNRGKMGVAAVPGSGKTQTLSFLAARLIHEGLVREDQEVLVVTLTNSAVGNFASRISNFIADFGLLPGMGFRVRTLHGLAHDIVRERPDLVYLDSNFNIVDQRESEIIIEESVRTSLLAHPEFEAQFLSEDHPIRRVSKDWMKNANDIARAFIKQAKDLRVNTPDIYALMGKFGYSDLLFDLGCEVYEEYQRQLSYRNGVDFDDLIRFALEALNADPDFLQRLRHRWPYILEDEAQDSSRLQEEILELLSADGGNWVRVGDPNQAIFETFTTADPELLRGFIQREDVVRRDLSNSGRSTHSIIDLANHLVDWTVHEHPILPLRDALFETYIEPTPKGDPQPNPSDDESLIIIQGPSQTWSSEHEINFTVQSLKQWTQTPGHESQTAAVLVTTNRHGTKLIEKLEENDIEYVELLRNTSDTRQTAEDLESILLALAKPTHSASLQRVYLHLRRPKQIKEKSEQAIVEQTAKYLHQCPMLESYLYPLPNTDWLADNASKFGEQVTNELIWLRRLFTRWQEATLLPIDQLILTIAADLYENPVDIALSHKLAQMLEFFARNHHDWNLLEYADQLSAIVKSQRTFSGLSENDTNFDPDDHAGKVTVATMHKAKGLEWDRVYLLSVNNYDFPSLDPFDVFQSEKYFIKNQLNLQDELITKLNALVLGDQDTLFAGLGEATIRAREKYAEERLRLLYVGITRARKELAILWNTGRRENCQPARALVELYYYWKEKQNAAQA
ncbi:MAG: ATP-dependent helicase, partial [Anaerolineaceae bacterium]|nr:ATP-dependent helicase [Anaerolineaceae bacterium]